ncbi:hypothetical protein REPUB_Repub06bG0028000 [Reevesia pubescens]
MISSSAFKELFFCQGDNGRPETHAGSLSQIRYLNLGHVSVLKHVWKQDSGITHSLPSLEHLLVKDCGDLISVGSSSAPFQNSMILQVCHCKSIIHLVPSSAVQSLVQLKLLIIKECVSVKEIVGNEEGKATYNIIFGKLQMLELEHLPKLESFCSGNHKFEFLYLELVLRGCPELKIFCPGVLNVPKLQSIQLTPDTCAYLADDLNMAIQYLYELEVLA